VKTSARNAALALALALSAVAWAQDTSASPRAWDAQVYGDVGLNFTSFSSDFGLGGTSTDFGLTFGGKLTYRLGDSLSVGPLANLTLIFANGTTAVPITAAGALTLARVLPVELTAGLGFTLYTGLGGGATPAGVAILAQALYPFSGLAGLGIHVQAVENLLNDGVNLFQLTAGVAYRF
jgi:hypothetical protein